MIQDYTTPPHNTLPRHLMTHLSPQITHLVSARPMSVTMGNAIRELKLKISKIDIDMVEQDVNQFLFFTSMLLISKVGRQRISSANISTTIFVIV